MNKSMLTRLAVSMVLIGGILAACASEQSRQPQSTVTGDAAQELAPYFARPTSGEIHPDANGFIQRWLLLEPIPQSLRSNQQLTDSFVQASVKREYFSDQFTVVPHDGDKVSVGDTELKWHAVDANRYDVNLYSFARALGKPTFNVLFWAVTIVNCHLKKQLSGRILTVLFWIRRLRPVNMLIPGRYLARFMKKTYYLILQTYFLEGGSYEQINVHLC
ncbi:MAG: hypothetical protein P8016_16360 [Sedimentisphaerales bacterium]